jgi:hypothetical protein
MRDCVWAWNHGIRGPDGKGSLRQPLHHRGWVVQERALSPRTLFFGSDMLFWECLQGKASEAEPDMNAVEFSPGPGGCTAASAGKMGPKSLFKAIRTLKDDGWEQWAPLWWQLVTEYTACELTNLADKWPAISAMAVELEFQTKQALYHGLWSNNLAEESLWSTDRVGSGRRENIPSWSWLSLDTVVHEHRYSTKEFENIATVVVPPGTRLAEDGLGSSREVMVYGSPIKVSWNIKTVNGKACYGFSFPSEHPFLIREHDYCRWKPDVLPKDEWELSILPFVMNKELSHVFESAGLMVRRSNGRNWVRVGFYEMVCRVEEDDDQERTFSRLDEARLFLA